MMQMLQGPGLTPANGGKPRRLIVLLHGLGADGQDLIGLAPYFAQAHPDAAFISPNAPFACDMGPYGYQWFSVQDRDPARILEGVKIAAPILNHFLDTTLAGLGLTDADLALVGFSQGTMMSLYAGLRRPAACAGIVGFSGRLVAPETLAAEIRSRPPVLLVHGNADPVVPYESLGVAEQGLRANGVPVETHTRPGLGHGIDEEGIALAQAFLARHLPTMV
jgi:phospholipase/carboxylesterase